jgi:hypothetical protein
MEKTKKERRCLKCTEVLGDVHASRKFCTPSVNEKDGTINNCKDDYHNAMKKPLRDLAKNVVKFHLGNFKAIDYFFGLGKLVVSTVELEGLGFKASYNFGKRVDPQTNEALVFYLGFLLRGNDKNKLKIEKHEYKF